LFLPEYQLIRDIMAEEGNAFPYISTLPLC
jgi:hypothetical protein